MGVKDLHGKCGEEEHEDYMDLMVEEINERVGVGGEEGDKNACC